MDNTGYKYTQRMPFLGELAAVTATSIVLPLVPTVWHGIKAAFTAITFPRRVTNSINYQATKAGIATGAEIPQAQMNAFRRRAQRHVVRRISSMALWAVYSAALPIAVYGVVGGLTHDEKQTPGKAGRVAAAFVFNNTTGALTDLFGLDEQKDWKDNRKNTNGVVSGLEYALWKFAKSEVNITNAAALPITRTAERVDDFKNWVIESMNSDKGAKFTAVPSAQGTTGQSASTVPASTSAPKPTQPKDSNSIRGIYSDAPAPK